MSIGIDLVYIPKFKQHLEKQETLEKLFTSSELEQFTSLESRAGVFAAKEAFMKAIGEKIRWHDVWVEKDSKGKPAIQSLITTSKSSTNLNISISHDVDYVVAVVMIMQQ